MKRKEIFTILTFSFLIFLPAFLFHLIQPSWDFLAYQLNSKWFCGNGKYFEWFRPPLVPLLLCIFPNYLYLFITSFLFVLALFLFTQKFKLKKEFFVLTLISPLVLMFGNQTGSDLISLAFLLFSFYFYPGIFSGFFYGLSLLTRYNYLIYFPFFLFKFKPKKFLLFLIFTFLIFSPWLVFNWVHKQDPLFSLKNSYEMNVQEREQAFGKILWHFFLLFFPLFFVLPSFKRIKFKKIDFFFLFLLVLTLISYFQIPYKFERYLLPATISISYFTCKLTKNFKLLLILTFLISLVIIFSVFWDMIQDKTRITWQDLRFLSFYLKNETCITSNFWVMLNYEGIQALPIPFPEQFDEYVKNGFVFVIHKYTKDPTYIQNQTYLSKLFIIYTNQKFLIAKPYEKCKLNINKVEISYGKIWIS